MIVIISQLLSMENILTTLLNSKIHVIFIGISAFTIADNSFFVMFSILIFNVTFNRTSFLLVKGFFSRVLLLIPVDVIIIGILKQKQKKKKKKKPG